MIPVLDNHDKEKILGYAIPEGSSVRVKLNDYWKRDDIFNVFGDIGYHALDFTVTQDAKTLVKEFRIHCYSKCK